MKPRAGIELVGAYLSVQWPSDKQYYEGRVLRFIERTGKHLILYETDYDDGYETEYANLNDRSRKWRRITDPFAESHNMSTPCALIGRIVVIDPDVNDTPKELRYKLACVVAVIHPKIHRMRRHRGRITCLPEKPLHHRVVWIHNPSIDDVDFNTHTYTLLH